MSELTSIRHVAVIKLDHAGDVLWAIPTIGTLKRNFPAARLSVFCTPYTRPVLEGHPGIDDLIAYEGGTFPPSLPRPDLAVCLDTRTHAVKLTHASRARIRTGYYYFPRGLSVLYPLLLFTHPVLHPASRGDFAHEVVVNQRLLERLGCHAEPEMRSRIFLTDAEQQTARDRLRALGHDGEPLIGLHLPLKWLDGGWPAKHVADLAGQIVTICPESRLLVTCGPGEESLLQELSPLLPSGSLAVSGLPFRIWAAAFSLCRLVVSRDCGPVHVAAAVDRPVISVFEESKRKEHTRWEPWLVPHVNVFRPDRFSPDAVTAFHRDMADAVRSLLTLPDREVTP